MPSEAAQLGRAMRESLEVGRRAMRRTNLLLDGVMTAIDEGYVIPGPIADALRQIQEEDEAREQ
jgi:hypothetical protein